MQLVQTLIKYKLTVKTLVLKRCVSEVFITIY